MRWGKCSGNKFFHEMRKRKKRYDKKDRVTNLGEEYDTVFNLAYMLGQCMGSKKTVYTIVYLRSGIRKTVITGNKMSCITKWFVAVPGTSEDDIMFMVLMALRSMLRITVREKGLRSRTVYGLNQLHIKRQIYYPFSEAIKTKGRVRYVKDGETVAEYELFVPKWTGWTLEQVYGLSGEAVEIDITGFQNRIPVLQLDKKTGEAIRCFGGVKDAARAMGDINRAGKISACCKGIRKKCFGFRWRYADSQEYV